MDKEYLSVTELNIYLENILDSVDLIHRICVVGEVSGLTLRGPHAYFTLKDANSQLKCCCFSYKKTLTPKDGDLILAFGSVDYYVKGGTLNFNVSEIQPYGQGLLAMQLEELKKKLTASGYFSESHKKAIPPFCQNIAVITSKDGAVLHDIVRTIRSKNAITNIDFFDVKVQGITCASTIIDTLKKVDTLGYDAIIIARGGGSYEDLMGFNDENLVYSIFDAVTPIVSAVGHETDTTLCDFVADLRVPTPTAAGELFAYDIEDYIENIMYLISSAHSTLKDKYSLRTAYFKDLMTRLVHGAETKNNNKFADVKLTARELSYAVSSKADSLESRLLADLSVLKASNPANILERGYAEIKNEDGSVVTDLTSLNVDDNIMLRAAKGSAKAKITEILE